MVLVSEVLEHSGRIYSPYEKSKTKICLEYRTW